MKHDQEFLNNLGCELEAEIALISESEMKFELMRHLHSDINKSVVMQECTAHSHKVAIGRVTCG
jgi:hypothetical protein